jgi:hypothetical protein
VDVIQDVGAYAGFAAVVGLAVLSALYFSQARDVRRLREWAGRAPERAAEQAGVATPEQAAQEASRPAASGAVRPIPAAKPVGAKADGEEKTAEQPAEAGKPGAPTPAGKPAPAMATGGKPVATPGTAPPVPATAAAAAKPATATGPAPATPAGAPVTDGPAKEKPGAPAKAADGAPPAPTPGPAPATPSARPPTPPPVLPARPAPPVRSPAAAAASQSTAVLPASSARFRDRARGATSGRDGLSARYIALIAAGVIVIGGGVAFGISQLGGGGDGGTSADQSGEEPQAPINPSTVTVSVLNGTTVPGLAAQIGDEVESAGFQRGNVANALDQQRTSSVVLYAQDADREAKLVAKKLGINAVEPIDPDSAALGGNASVVVIVGADQTS